MGCTSMTSQSFLTPNQEQPIRNKYNKQLNSKNPTKANNKFQINQNQNQNKNSSIPFHFDNSIDSEQLILMAEYIFRLNQIISFSSLEELLKFQSLKHLQSNSQYINLKEFETFLEFMASEMNLKLSEKSNILTLYNFLSKNDVGIQLTSLHPYLKLLMKALVEMMIQELKKKKLIYGGILILNINQMSNYELINLINEIDLKRRAKFLFFGFVRDNEIIKSNKELIQLIEESISQVFDMNIISGIESLLDSQVLPYIEKNSINEIWTISVYKYLNQVANEIYEDLIFIQKKKSSNQNTDLISERISQQNSYFTKIL